MNIKKYLVTLFKIFLAIGIIFSLVKQDKIDFSKLKSFLVWDFLLFALVATGINLFLVSERWRLLLSTQNAHPKSAELYKLTLIGIFFNFAMPGGVGGDVLKAFYFYKDHPKSKAIAISSVFVDRLLGLYTIIFMALGAMVYDLNHVMNLEVLRNLFYFFCLIFVFFNIGLFFLFSKNPKICELVLTVISKLPLKEKFEKLYTSGQLYGSQGPLLVKVFLLSLFSQTCAIFIMYLIGHYSNVGAEVALRTYFLVTPIGFMVTAIPITPGSLGVGQAAFDFLFNLYLGHDTKLGATVITVFQVLSLFFGIIGAYFYLVKSRKKDTLDAMEMELINSK